MGDKLFDYCIGNPPYQEDKIHKDKNLVAPVYDKFMDAAFDVADKVEMITPARFLFDAGGTSSNWNQERLNDEHFKVMDYKIDSKSVFPGVDIKGGVAITYRDENRNFGKIRTFTTYSELNTIVKKTVERTDFNTIQDIIFNQNRFDLDALYNEHPDYRDIIGNGGKERRIVSSSFSFTDIFTTSATEQDDIKILGMDGNKRVYRYIHRRYVDAHENLDCYKVIVPKANGSGAIGEVLSTPLIGTPLIGTPLIGYTQTFLSIGQFDNMDDAMACLKYIKTKFARTMLGVLKITQNGNKNVWRYVPLQDFTSASDIDWSKSIPEIDRQLYSKYGLSLEEIEFIESHVKAME